MTKQVNGKKVSLYVDESKLKHSIHGGMFACVDCHATGALVLLPGKRVVGHIWHDDGCPAAAGVTEWQPHPLDEGETA